MRWGLDVRRTYLGLGLDAWIKATQGPSNLRMEL